MQSKIKQLVVYLIVFVLGMWCGRTFYPVTIIQQAQQAKAEVTSTTDTNVAYVQKSQGEQTDLQIDIPKSELNVRINGQETVFKKSDTEKFLFDKNKVALQQTSKATLDITVPVVDKTKYWSAGIGYGSNGVAGTIGFPINKKSALGGWVYADRETKAIGINIGF